MFITSRPDGHLWWPATSFQKAALGLQSNRLDECVEMVRAQDVRGVFGRFPEFTERNVDFLAKLPDLEDVQFWDVKLDDLEGLYQLPQLRFLRIAGKRPPIDFRRLPTLVQLNIEHHAKDCGFEELSGLTMLDSWRYKPARGATFDLTVPGSLQELRIVWSPVETISPLPLLPDLIASVNEV